MKQDVAERGKEIGGNFIVNTLTTANQRAKSKSSSSTDVNSFILSKKMTSTTKAGIAIAHQNTVGSLALN